MKKSFTSWKIIGILGIIALAIFASPNYARAQESGNVCVADLGGNSCTANDVRFEALTPVQVLEGCGQGEIGVTEVIFDAHVASDGSPTRYDIGLYFALDGGSAYDGDSCYHDYLQGPLTTTPNYSLDLLPIGSAPDGTNDTIDHTVANDFFFRSTSDTATDTCGDIAQNRAVLKRIAPIRIACVDNDLDGAADVSVCTSWKNNATQSEPAGGCVDVTAAVPGTPSKCNCTTINFAFTPTAISLSNSSTNSPNGVVLALLAVAVGGLVSILFFRRRSNSNLAV